MSSLATVGPGAGAGADASIEANAPNGAGAGAGARARGDSCSIGIASVGVGGIVFNQRDASFRVSFRVEGGSVLRWTLCHCMLGWYQTDVDVDGIR